MIYGKKTTWFLCVCGNVWVRRTGDDWNVLVRETFGLEGRVGERNVGVFIKLGR